MYDDPASRILFLMSFNCVTIAEPGENVPQIRMTTGRKVCSESILWKLKLSGPAILRGMTHAKLDKIVAKLKGRTRPDPAFGFVCETKQMAQS